MIPVERVTETGDVVRLLLARWLAGRWGYYSRSAYWVNGLLVDTGCFHSADQLKSAKDNVGVEQVVNAHSHEDQIGADADVQERFRCPVKVREGGAKLLQ